MKRASTMPSILAYTITRADTPERARLLLETISRGRETADAPFHWRVYVNGAPSLAGDIIESCLATGLVDDRVVYGRNVGQHPPTNEVISASAENTDYILRIDDDVEWLSKRWLAKMLDASSVLKDTCVLSPQVKGLRWQPPQSQTIEVETIPIRYISGPIGGICRLTPVKLLKEKPYISDVRLPMGGGDAEGVWRWAQKAPITPLVYLQHIRIRHAKTTDEQVRADPKHFQLHRVFQHLPYIPMRFE